MPAQTNVTIAPCESSAAGSTIPGFRLLTANRPTELTDFHLTAQSEVLAEHLAIGLEAGAEIEGTETGMPALLPGV